MTRASAKIIMMLTVAVAAELVIGLTMGTLLGGDSGSFLLIMCLMPIVLPTTIVFAFRNFPPRRTQEDIEDEGRTQ